MPFGISRLITMVFRINLEMFKENIILVLIVIILTYIFELSG